MTPSRRSFLWGFLALPVAQRFSRPAAVFTPPGDFATLYHYAEWFDGLARVNAKPRFMVRR